MFIVGVGSSAGGLEALRQVTSNLTAEMDNFCLVIAQHISPDYKSHLVEILSPLTSWKVLQAKDKLKPEGGSIYITPPKHEIYLTKTQIRLHKSNSPNKIHAHPSVDRLFASIAENFGDHAIGVILSGTGKDGSEGVTSIRAAGGLVISQNTSDAGHASMPDFARRTGVVSISCDAHEIPVQIHNYIRNFDVVNIDKVKSKNSMDFILDLLTKKFRTNFNQYKSSTINRRLEKRMQDLKITSMDDYHVYIQKSPQELDLLYQTVLIGVTEFYRDPEAFKALESKIRDIINENTDHRLRFWSVGCATGEEAYTLAILVAEILGDRLKDYAVQIFATDIDDSALIKGRKGIYRTDQIQNLPEEVIRKYFSVQGEKAEISKQLRQLVLFSKHDITIDPPFVRLDVITCRNLLIYFKSALQKDVLPVFHYALNPGGYLLIGKSENVAQVRNLFQKAHTNQKIFQRKENVELNVLKFKSFRKDSYIRISGREDIRPEMTLEEMARETLIRTYEHPYVVLDSQMDTQLIKGSLRPFLDLSEGAVNASILKIIHKDLHTDLRTLFAKVKRRHKWAKTNILRFTSGDEECYVRLMLKPMLFSRDHQQLFLLIFEQIDRDERYPFIPEEIQGKDFSESIRIIELEQELNASREHLQTFTEELETSNEELQAMNEELQSSNEELKSTNEELETSNEELQSTNEELQTAITELNVANENLQQKEAELLETKKELELTNNRFKLLLDNSNIFMALQDLELTYIWAYNQTREYTLNELYGSNDRQLFGTNEADAFINVKKRVLKTQHEEEQEVIFNDRYWHMQVRPWKENGILKGVLVLAVNITEQKRAQRGIELRNKSIDSLITRTNDYLLIVDNELTVQVISNRLQSDLREGYGIQLTAGTSLVKAVGDHKKVKTRLMRPLRKALTGEVVYADQFEAFNKNGTEETANYNLKFLRIEGDDDEPLGVTLVGHEITRMLHNKQKIQAALRRNARMVEEAYFEDLTLQLNDLFEFSYTYVGLINENKKSITTKSFRVNGRREKEKEYELKGTPCEKVYHEGEIFVLHDVEIRYPDDPKLKEWHSQTYVGVPIFSPTSSEVLGIIVMIDPIQQELDDDDEYLLTILSLRAGAEIQRSEANLELYQRERQLENITYNSPDVVYEFQIYPDGKEQFNYISEALYDIYELTPAEARSNPKRMYEVLHPDDHDGLTRYKSLNFENPSPVKWEGRIISAKTRTEKWVRVSAKPEVQTDGSVIYNGIIDDVTEYKMVENELRSAREKAEEAALAKENFLATMSHEIRTPLSAIQGVIELLQLDKKPENFEDYLDVLKYSTDQLMALINNILDFSKIKSGKFKLNKHEFNLKQAIENTMKALNYQADKSNTSMTLHYDEQMPESIICDEVVMSQILTNLLSNAVKFTENGEVQIHVDAEEIINDKLKTRVSIQDTGIGISHQDLEAIFEKFEQGKFHKSSSGSGLGLTITKALLELMGTKIEVETNEGDGSTFSFLLECRIPDREIKPESNGNSVSDKNNKNIHILIVEDNDDNRVLLKSFLSRFDHFALSEARSGREALKRLENKDVDFVFMDMRMDDMRGDEATKILREKKESYYRNLPIIALTADTYGIQTSVGFTDVVTKPYQFKQIKEVIDKYTD